MICMRSMILRRTDNFKRKAREGFRAARGTNIIQCWHWQRRQLRTGWRVKRAARNLAMRGCLEGASAASVMYCTDTTDTDRQSSYTCVLLLWYMYISYILEYGVHTLIYIHMYIFVPLKSESLS